MQWNSLNMKSLPIFANKSPIHTRETIPLEFVQELSVVSVNYSQMCQVLTGANPFFFTAGLACGWDGRPSLEPSRLLEARSRQASLYSRAP
jgi:hypothetical protein